MTQTQKPLSEKLSELARILVPALIGGLLWSYLAAAMLYGAVQA